MKLPNAEQMRKLDAAAINDFGIPGLVLMENAGRGAVAAMNCHYGSLVGKKIAIVIGPGNNGGDGFVMARHLHRQGARPEVFLLVGKDKLIGDAAANAAIVGKLPVPVFQINNTEDLKSVDLGGHFAESRVIIDAIFGTGLKREVTGHFAEVIRAMNDSGRPVVAVDIPSGLDSDLGRPLGVCAKADLTVTFGLAKPGLFMQPGAGFCGALEVVDIGIPPEALASADIKLELLDKATMVRLVPERQAADHKGKFGHVLIVAGSTGKIGAALLAAGGCLAAGPGLVTLCVPQSVTGGVFESLPEAMTVALPKSTIGHLTIDDYHLVQEAAVGKSALVLGPGLGMAPETIEVVKRLYAEVKVPMVIDADGLNALAGEIDLLKKQPAARILTPHPGEMAGLTGMATKKIQGARLTVAAEFSRRHQVVLVLKGAGTIIAAPDGRLALNSTGNPGMATGGMGDVLAGLLGGLLAQGVPAWEAACLGVYVHGLAADRLANERGIAMGIRASEVVAGLPKAFGELSNFCES